jgi:hypothetical protein
VFIEIEICGPAVLSSPEDEFALKIRRRSEKVCGIFESSNVVDAVADPVAIR